MKRKNWLLKLKCETSYTLPKVWVCLVREISKCTLKA